MSRILIATVPFVGHVSPATVVVRALVARGHDVVWYTGRAFERQVEATGARFIPLSPELDFDPTRLHERYPELDRMKGLARLNHTFKVLCVDPIPAYMRDLERILHDFPADLLFTDSGFTAGRAARHRFALPWVSFGPAPLMCSSVDTAPFGAALKPSASLLGRLRNRAINALFDHVLMAKGAQMLRDVERRLGVPDSALPWFDIVVHEPDLYLQASPAELEYPRSDLPGNVRFIGPLLPKAPSDAARPSWWPELSAGRPVVHVTQGTVDNHDLGKLLVPTLEALADEDVLVIATTGGKPLSDVKMTLPANVRLETFVPHDALLPFVNVMITNAGFGGVQRALANGVPLVVAGDTEDKPEVCQRVAWAEVGVNLRTGSPSPARIRAAVREVLSRDQYRTRAGEMRRVIARYDAPSTAATLIEELLRARGALTSPQDAVPERTPVLV